MWLLFERVKLTHSKECPAVESQLWYRPIERGKPLDTAIVNVLREPKHDVLGVPADQAQASLRV